MDEYRVLILPPGARDGEVTARLLRRAGLSCHVCADPRATVEQIREGAGALILTEVNLGRPDIEPLRAALAAQPPWSDLPVVLLCPASGQSDAVAAALSIFTNVTILERPASARTLVSAIQAALRGRVRQYQTRHQLMALEQAQDGLRARERQLREADRRKDEFLAMLAHELRNPLAPIRNVSELLGRQGAENSRIRAMADILRRQITHLTRIVDDLLDVSRVTQGRIELQPETVDLASVVADACESVQPLVSERRHTLRCCPVSERVCVNGDKARLVQCVSNLLINAAKYTDPGGLLEVNVRARGPHACITVSDNGVGISPELLPQIFELFVQSARSLDRAQGGLGIGLSVVKRLVDMHGGSVTAESDGPGQGSRFEICLPRIETPSAHAGPLPASAEGPARRVLVVDDNQDAADSLVMILSSLGHEAQAAYTSEEALALIERRPPEVVFLDIGLPGMDGYGVATRLRERKLPIFIVALTGYGQPEDRRKAAAAGIDAHLVKPVDLAQLEEALAGNRQSRSSNVLPFGRRQA
jgi:signal transduction histidine kinase/ActR/RegA family two-component response regulator